MTGVLEAMRQLNGKSAMENANDELYPLDTQLRDSFLSPISIAAQLYRKAGTSSGPLQPLHTKQVHDVTRRFLN